MSYRIIKWRASTLRLAIKRDKNHPDAHLKKLLEGGDNFFWSQKEKDLCVKLFKKHGKNYSLIANKLKTRTASQVYIYGKDLHTKIKKNPKHIHKALKEKLKPTVSYVPWTVRELNLLLKGLKENMKCWDWIK